MASEHEPAVASEQKIHKLLAFFHGLSCLSIVLGSSEHTVNHLCRVFFSLSYLEPIGSPFKS